MLLAAVASCMLALPDASTAGPTVLYSFTAPTFPGASPVTNGDGIAPASRPVLGSDGYLYGTTLHGGENGAGSIFRVSTGGAFSNLYSFPAATNNSGEVVYDLGPTDLSQGTNGSFYGATRSGGSNFNGTLFVISPSGSFATLHTFAAETTNSSGHLTSPDGATPTGALAQGNDGNFYGTTKYGGANGTGTIFQITPGGGFTSLYSFGRSVAGSAATNGSVPNPLVLESNGVFYGTTQQGGLDNAGAVFKFTVTGGFAQFYSFDGAAPGDNPITPNSALVQGTNGNFYGTSAFGGSQGGGTIFEITDAGGVTVLHSFPQLDAGAGSALTLGVDGNFYGTTSANGLNGNGTVFRMTPAGDFGAYSFSALDANSDNADGANPSDALTTDSAGDLYGTCAAGGTNGSGIIFQIFGADFNPPSFLSASNSPPALTNVLVGASVSLINGGEGIAPLTYQWLRNGTNLTDGGDILGSTTNSLAIKPVLPGDVGSYALVISNIWGALTSSVTVLTVTPPGISISSPAPNARSAVPVFAGTATNAPLFPNTNPNEALLTGVIFSITNTFNGSNITGLGALSAGVGSVSNWSFTATPFPGTNVLSVQSVDASGNTSPAASRTFFYKVAAPLGVVTTGSGTGTFNITNGTMLDLGEGFSITARPISSVFSDWVGAGIISYEPTFPFVMQSNLVLTADFMSRRPPSIFISFPAANARTGLSVYQGTAQSSPALLGVNPNNLRLTNVVYWLTNAATGNVITGVAALTSGAAASNWVVTATPLPGTNALAVQTEDVSGGLSPIVSRTFFYKVPSVFSLLKAGTGNGTFMGTASVHGDIPPTNSAMLNIGESYTVTAKPERLSTFSGWISSAGISSAGKTFSFVMQPDFTLTATFATNVSRVTAGTYNGLFFPAGVVNEETSGMLYDLILRNTGAFSAQLLTVATNYHIAADFDDSGHATFRAGPLQIALDLDSDSQQITGTVSGPQFTANLTAKLASNALPLADYSIHFSAPAVSARSLPTMRASSLSAGAG